MHKHLKFINKENEKILDDSGNIVRSVEKMYFNYSCHTPDDPCQLETVMCRTADQMQPFNEPVWESSEAECRRCIKSDSRLLEDIYEFESR